MPLINGMKMACEPCIRGHRSTKCNHANERLMVPVRKPGRPLSACPHPANQACGCGSVTAAIPRKQTCHCGGGSTPDEGQPITPQPSSFPGSDLPSPTKPIFRIEKQKPSRKPSYGAANFERMGPNQMNVQTYGQPQNVSVAFQNGYAITTHPQMYGYTPPYTQVQPQYIIPMQSPHSFPHNGTNGYVNGGMPPNGLEHVIESPPATPTTFGSGDSGKFVNGTTNGDPTPISNGGEARKANGGSCCAPRQNGHSHTSSVSSISEPPEAKVASCCSSKATKTEPISSTQSTPQLTHQILPQNGMHFNPVLYPQFAPQPTVFTYPATYGSFQNPLQPSAWRQSIRTNNYSQAPPFPPGHLPFDAPLAPGSLDTIHTCSCGDTCQCVGCAAHPYNDATQDYVRSAYNITQEPPISEPYSNGHTPNGNGITTTQPPSTEPVSSPTAHTPSSTTSGNGEEQSLSAADFFFVSYPFSGDGCGGDTQSCPCGDDCECLGCTIHRQPMPCAGDESGCLCGDDCQCIGCEIHKSVDLGGAMNGVGNGVVDGPVTSSCCG